MHWIVHFPLQEKDVQLKIFLNTINLDAWMSFYLQTKYIFTEACKSVEKKLDCLKYLKFHCYTQTCHASTCVSHYNISHVSILFNIEYVQCTL